MTVVRLPPAMIEDAFGLGGHFYIHLIGGGGKTTLMFTLARHLAATGRSVVSTTSTQILAPPPHDSGRVAVESDVGRAIARLRAELPSAGHMTIARSLRAEEQKLCGYSAEELDTVRAAGVADHVLVEADGAAGRSIKAHADHEPVVSSGADLVIAVIGSDCIGCPMTGAHVHRAARFAALADRAIGTAVTVDDVARVFFHPLGYLKAVPRGADVIVMISKAAAGERKANAWKLAAALRAADIGARLARIVVGELSGPMPYLEVLH